MLETLLAPLPSAKILVSAFLAILFLQSGLDKILDFKGNLAWLQGHFAKSPLRGQVTPMLAAITLTETLAGLACAVGTVQLAMGGASKVALWGAQLATLNVVMLFFGQRMAKDYAGAASLVPYFIACVGAIVLVGS